jgi:hypothetical protein
MDWDVVLGWLAQAGWALAGMGTALVGIGVWRWVQAKVIGEEILSDEMLEEAMERHIDRLVLWAEQTLGELPGGERLEKVMEQITLLYPEMNKDGLRHFVEAAVYRMNQGQETMYYIQPEPEVGEPPLDMAGLRSLN